MDSEAECDVARVGDVRQTRRNVEGAARATLLTDDGVRIEAEYTPYRAGTPDARGARGAWGARGARDLPVIVIAHGFTGALERPALRRAAGVFALHAAVVSFSFRGHGRSGGRSTLGDREVLDLAAAVRWARALGHQRVATVGFSMGGSVTVRHAALYGTSTGSGTGTSSHPAAVPSSSVWEHTDAVAAVSSPARWYYRGTAPMRRLHWAVQRPAGRLFTRWGLGTRVHAHDWDPVPLSPTEAAPAIAPTPLLVVHGNQDAYFPLDHPRALLAAADPAHAQLWLEPGFGHAENAAPNALLRRIARWSTHVTAPDHVDGVSATAPPEGG